MVLEGSLINAVVVAIAGILGTVVRRGVPERISKAILSGMALCVIYIGIDGLSSGTNPVIAILSMAFGIVIGEAVDIDKWLNRLGDKIQSAVSKGKAGSGPSVAEGFVAATMLFCVGAWAVTGAISGGASGDHSSLIAKSVVDGISAFMLATTLGVGVALASVPLLLYQGGIAVAAYFIGSNINTVTLGEISCVGSLIIIAIGLNMLGVTKVKVANMIPAIFLPLLFCLFL